MALDAVIAFAGPASGAIGLLGFLAIAVWLLWRFGLTLVRLLDHEKRGRY
ncbi:MAG: hypothetical protein WB698_05645 [Solirubrobacteraceae bacterium]